MSRRRAAKKRVVLADPKYNDYIVAKFINCIMEKGKKSVAESIVYDAFDVVQSRMSSNPLAIFLEVIKSISPTLEVRSRRVGGATYQVPVKVRDSRAIALAIRWLINASRSRAGRTMSEKLAAELMDAANNRGAAVKKRDDTHKMAEANRAFSHFAW
jgi:small subunit ribosomal protein S7